MHRIMKKKLRRGLALLLSASMIMSMNGISSLTVKAAEIPELYCELEEHSHTEECYAGELICGIEEGEEHTHEAMCYALSCGLEAHTHTDECYVNPEEGENLESGDNELGEGESLEPGEGVEEADESLEPGEGEDGEKESLEPGEGEEGEKESLEPGEGEDGEKESLEPGEGEDDEKESLESGEGEDGEDDENTEGDGTDYVALCGDLLQEYVVKATEFGWDSSFDESATTVWAMYLTNEQRVALEEILSQFGDCYDEMTEEEIEEVEETYFGLMETIGTLSATINGAMTLALFDDDRIQVDYPYLAVASDTGFSINVDTRNGGYSRYQWQIADTKGGPYSDIAGESAFFISTHFDNPISASDQIDYQNKWVRCLLDNNEMTYPIQLIKAGGNTYRFIQNAYNGKGWWYASNGSHCYTIFKDGGIYDVRGLYTKDGVTYWMGTSFDNVWWYGCETASEPAPGAGRPVNKYSGVKQLIMKFDPVNPATVKIDAVLKPGYHAFTVGTDTKLGNKPEITNYADDCSLKAIFGASGNLQQIQMVGAYSVDTAVESDPAFVFNPVTAPSTYWIGRYSFVKSYSYNEGNVADKDYYTYIDDDVNKPVCEIRGLDSIMNVSWMNLPDNATVQFGYNIGTVEETGAIIHTEAETTSRTVIVRKAVPDVFYSLYLKGTEIQVKDWVKGSAAVNQEGDLIFTGLTPNTEYEVRATSAKADDASQPDVSHVVKTDATTYIEPLEQTADKHPSLWIGDTMVEIRQPIAGYTYKAITGNGDVAAVGAVGNGGTVRIEGLTPDTDYQLIAHTATNSKSDKIPFHTDKLTVTASGNIVYDGAPVEKDTDFMLATTRDLSHVSYQYKLNGTQNYSDGLPTNAGGYNFKVSFPEETVGEVNHLELSKIAGLNIQRCAVVITVSGSPIDYGQTLADSVLTATALYNDVPVAGTFAWKFPETAPTVADSETTPYRVIFIPADPENYTSAEQDITIVVNKIVVQKPVSTAHYVYTGLEQIFDVASTNDYTATNTTRTIAGSQDVLIALRDHDNYEWNDGTNDDFNLVFTIDKADQDAPANLQKTDETIRAKADGTISGLNSGMEYRYNDESEYTEVVGNSFTDLPSGSYKFRYKENMNFNASPDTEVIIEPGRRLKITILPRNQVGYTFTSNVREVDYNGVFTLMFRPEEGYGPSADFNISATVGTLGQPVAIGEYIAYSLTNVVEDTDVTLTGIEDIGKPLVRIDVDRSSWNEFLNTITFGVFFKDTQAIKVTARDNESGIDKVYYYTTTTPMTNEQAINLPDASWTEISNGGSFRIDPERLLVVYAKAVDMAGNFTIVSSDGMVFDTTAPVVKADDIEMPDGADRTFYKDDKVTISIQDNNLRSVTFEIDGVDKTASLVNGKYDIPYNAEHKTHPIVVKDGAGNKVSIIVTLERSPEQEAYDFRVEFADILGKPFHEITDADMPRIQQALTKYDTLSPAAREILQPEKNDLDAKEFLADNSDILHKKLEDVTQADFPVILDALDDYDQLRRPVQQLLIPQKELLEAMLRLAQDNTAPQIIGIEDGRTYSADKTIRIVDDNLPEVRVVINGNLVGLDRNGEIILAADGSTYTIEARDPAGNYATATVTIHEPTPDMNSVVTAGTGKVQGEVYTDIAMPFIHVGNLGGEEARNELTEEEIAVLGAEDTYHVYFDITRIDKDAVSQGDADLIRSKAAWDNSEVFFDISLFKKLNDGVSERIYESANEYSITMALPQELLHTEDNVNRTFNIVRVHNGEAENIYARVREDGLITFNTNKFSTYALTYQDEMIWTIEDKIVQQINLADPGATVKVPLCYDICSFTNYVMEALQNKKTVNLQFEYIYDNNYYKILIPANSEPFVEGIRIYGPLYLANMYGNTKISLEDNPLDSVPKTGDCRSQGVWLGMVVIGMAGCALTFRRKIRRRFIPGLRRVRRNG